jgi:hypothetical protein
MMTLLLFAERAIPASLSRRARDDTTGVRVEIPLKIFN